MVFKEEHTSSITPSKVKKPMRGKPDICAVSFRGRYLQASQVMPVMDSTLNLIGVEEKAAAVCPAAAAVANNVARRSDEDECVILHVSLVGYNRANRILLSIFPAARMDC
ncbi:Ap-4 Complex Subunit Mu-1 [Manis pentadactyla]|nr:Ap-4 Complex Subunit Mu-1 [Manis pentadactyla]